MRFKALVHVRLRGSVSDAAGNAVMKNTHMVAPKLQPHLLRIGKAIDFWFDAETEEIAREQMDLLSDRMLANTVIEDWEYTLEETEETGIGTYPMIMISIICLVMNKTLEEFFYCYI